MADNQSFSWIELIILAVAVGLGFLFFFFSAPLWLIGTVPVAITMITLIWHNIVLSRHRAANTVILTRSPVLLLGGTGMMVIMATLLILFVQNRAQSFAAIFLVLFLGGLTYIASLPSALFFYVADMQGLSRQVLSFRKVLPWHAIDWIYAQNNRVSAKAQISLVDVPVFRWTEKLIVIEAGAKRHLTLLTRAPLIRGNATPLIDAIRSRATNALIGFEQLPAVNARRANDAAPGNRPAFRDMSTAMNLVRQGVLSQGCTIFPARLRPIWLNLQSMIGAGIGFLGVGIYTISADYSILLHIIPQFLIPAGLLPFFPLLDLVIFVIFGVVFLAIGLPWIGALRDTRSYFFLVTPSGFAAVKGKKIKGALFTDTYKIELSNGGLYGQQIKTTLRNGKSFAIEVNIYGRARDLLAYLLAARKSELSQPTESLGLIYQTEQDVSN